MGKTANFADLDVSDPCLGHGGKGRASSRPQGPLTQSVAASWGLWGPVGGGVSNVSNGPIPEIPRCEKKPELHVTAPMVSGVKTESWLLGEAGKG